MKTLLLAGVLLFTLSPTNVSATAVSSFATPTRTLDKEVPHGLIPDSTEGRPLKATLSGENEVPDPADPDGSGMAEVTLNLGQQEVCYELSVENIGPATLAHIHAAPAGENGAPVITLDAPSDGSSSGCVSDVSKDLIREILKSPSDYYVNVHNADYPAGAVRGQLTKEGIGAGSR